MTTQDGDVLAADGVILTPEAHQAARLLRYVDPSLALLLEGIPYASSATVTLAYRRAAIRHPLDGFGFVVPHAEGRPIIAGTFSSVKYPGRAPEGHVLLRVFLGGALREAVLEQDDERLAEIAREQLRDLLGVGEAPLWTRVARYARPCRSTTSATWPASRRSSWRSPAIPASPSPAAPTAAWASPTASAPARTPRAGCSSAEARRYARDSSASRGRWTSSTASRYRNGNGLVT